MLTGVRLRVALSTMKCREAWQLSPRQWWGMLKALRSTRPVSTPAGLIVYANCPPVGGKGYRRYLRGLKQLSRGQYCPLVAHVSVTDRCDYACPQCSNVSRTGSDPAREKLVALLDGLRRAGTASVALTGGEPLLREDLPQIVEACGEEMPPLLFTTGDGLDEGRAGTLRSAGLVGAFVSLDYDQPEEHDRMRGHPGAFRQALRAIDACLGAGLYTAVQAIVRPPLLADGAPERFLRFCGRLGVHDVILLEPMAVRCLPNPHTLDEADKERLRQLHLRAVSDPALPKVTAIHMLESSELFGCQAGYAFLYVSAAGEVCPCDFVPISFGNVHELGCEEVLRRLAERFPLPASGCMAMRLAELLGEAPDMPVPWEQTCRIMSHYRPDSVPGIMKCVLPAKGGHR